MNCSNCENPIKEPAKALVMTRGPDGDLLAAICETCQQGVKTLKVVLARTHYTNEFMFEGYLPVSSVK